MSEQSGAETKVMTVPKQTSPLAICSLVLGIIGLGCILLAIAAVVCGHIGRSKIRAAPDRLEGDGMATAGLIMGYVGIGLQILLLGLVFMWYFMNLKVAV